MLLFNDLGLLLVHLSYLLDLLLLLFVFAFLVFGFLLLRLLLSLCGLLGLLLDNRLLLGLLYGNRLVRLHYSESVVIWLRLLGLGWLRLFLHLLSRGGRDSSVVSSQFRGVILLSPVSVSSGLDFGEAGVVVLLFVHGFQSVNGQMVRGGGMWCMVRYKKIYKNI